MEGWDMVGALIEANRMARDLWISKFGVALAFVGALLIVISAFRKRVRIKGSDGAWRGMDKLPATEKAIRRDAGNRAL